MDAGLNIVYSELEKEMKSAIGKAKNIAENGIVIVYDDIYIEN